MAIILSPIRLLASARLLALPQLLPAGVAPKLAGLLLNQRLLVVALDSALDG